MVKGFPSAPLDHSAFEKIFTCYNLELTNYNFIAQLNRYKRLHFPQVGKVAKLCAHTVNHKDITLINYQCPRRANSFGYEILIQGPNSILLSNNPIFLCGGQFEENSQIMDQKPR